MGAFSRRVASVVLASVLGLRWTGSWAQTSTAVCSSSFTWMDNHKSQDPCLVAAYLISPCLAFPSEAEVLSLPSTASLGVTEYTVPGTFYAASTCMCSSVLYSLLAACSICQGYNFHTWAEWMAPCPASLISVAGYPDNIPAAVSVPQWAYQDVSSTGGFDVQVAEAAAAKAPPDITQSVPGKTVAPTGAPTGPPIPSASVPAFSAPAFSVPSVSVPAPTFGTGDDFHVHKKTNVGAIVGGVVGGVSTLLAIIGGIWARMRRRANRLAAAAANKPSEEGAAGTPDPEKLHATSPSTAPTQTTQTTEYFPTLPTNGPPPRLYDPDDPSTYPDAHLFSNTPSMGPSLSHPATTPPAPPQAIPSHSGGETGPTGYVPTEF